MTDNGITGNWVSKKGDPGFYDESTNTFDGNSATNIVFENTGELEMWDKLRRLQGQYGMAEDYSGLAGGIISGAANLGAAAINAASTYRTNLTNQKIAKQANELQEKIFNQSLSFEERKFAEQQLENIIARQREDTEVTRRMADLANAGINPLLAGRYDSQTGWGSVAGGVVNGFTPVTIPNVAPRISEEAIAGTGRTITEALSAREERKIKQEQIEINKYEADVKQYEAMTKEKISDWQEKLYNENLNETKANNLRNFIIEVRKCDQTMKKIDNDYQIALKQIHNQEEYNATEKTYKEAMATVAKYNAFTAKDANDIKMMATEAQIKLNEAMKSKWISEETRGYIHEALNYIEKSQDRAVKLLGILF